MWFRYFSRYPQSLPRHRKGGPIRTFLSVRFPTGYPGNELTRTAALPERSQDGPA